MEIKTKEVTQLPYCPKGRYNISLEQCKHCEFYDGMNGDCVNCLNDGLYNLSSVSVTRFTVGDTDYYLRKYDKDVDGEIDGDDPYDYCQKCEMLKRLPNGNSFCAIRSSVPKEAIYPFICGEEMIWKKDDKK